MKTKIEDICSIETSSIMKIDGKECIFITFTRDSFDAFEIATFQMPGFHLIDHYGFDDDNEIKAMRNYIEKNIDELWEIAKKTEPNDELFQELI